MRNFAWIAMLLTLTFGIFVGCSSNDPEPEPEPEPFEAPTSLTFVTYQDSVRLDWNHSPDAADSGFLGYYVYSRIAPLANVDVDSLQDYALFADPIDAGEFSVTGITSSSKHYFGLRAVKVNSGDTTYSPLSVEVNTSPTIWGGGMVYEIGADTVSAVDFSGDAVYEMELIYLNEIDIYLGVDTENNLQWRSPTMFGADWSDRVSQIKPLGTGLFSDFFEAGSGGWLDSSKVDLGKIYAFKTPDNHYVKLIVVDISGIFPDRNVEFEFAYQDVVNYDRF